MPIDVDDDVMMANDPELGPIIDLAYRFKTRLVISGEDEDMIYDGDYKGFSGAQTVVVQQSDQFLVVGPEQQLHSPAEDDAGSDGLTDDGLDSRTPLDEAVGGQWRSQTSCLFDDDEVMIPAPAAVDPEWTQRPALPEVVSQVSDTVPVIEVSPPSSSVEEVQTQMGETPAEPESASDEAQQAQQQGVETQTSLPIADVTILRKHKAKHHLLPPSLLRPSC